MVTEARLAVRRKPSFRDEELALLNSLNSLDGVDLDSVAIINIYNVYDSTAKELASLSTNIVADLRSDEVLSDEQVAALADTATLTVEPLLGQYDQRADSTEQALRLLHPNSQASITTAVAYVCEPAPSPIALKTITAYLINPVESQLKDLGQLQKPDYGEVEDLPTFPDFLTLDDAGLTQLITVHGFAMSLADIQLIQDYFRQEERPPTYVELSALDTYWSDHCRHTTFNTELVTITNSEPRYRERLDRVLARYEEIREANGRTHKPRTLMDMGTIMGRELRRTGVLTDQELSEEVNAASVYVDVAGQDEPWLLMFKNETHNHPTEIEPFGGASTCLGGAIRDPLSGRSWVYQAMRITGAGDINTPRADTLDGKLAQRDISTRATQGYSSYGNQIGVAATGVRELVHPGYVAKRMELGAVVAAAPAENVRRLDPEPGDIVIMLGGRTGRDGVGGATGSSQAHDEDSWQRSGAEVQKGNPLVERNILRLFRRPEVAQMIIRSNDFGAGGVSVAVGELADSLDIYLERVPLKYPGLNAQEIALSESQERMAVVVRAENREAFIAAAEEENIEAVHLADITDTGRMRMFFNGDTVVDLSREFLDTNGAQRSQAVDMVASAASGSRPDSIRETLQHYGSQEGMAEQFDSTVGRSTVLMPYGGSTQKTNEQVSIQTLPVPGGTSTASALAYGYSPALADDSPYLMGAYSVVEALAKLTAAGADPTTAWLSNQEYFQRLDQDPQKWGEVTQAMLGLLEAQDEFKVAAIGGKDSMSGTFGDDLHVPPTLVTFGVATIDTEDVVSAVLPTEADLYLFAHEPLEGAPNYEQLRQNFARVNALRPAAAMAVTEAGLAHALVNMAIGNEVGINVEIPEAPIGSIVVAVPPGTFVEGAIRLGSTTSDQILNFGTESFSIEEAVDLLESGYREIYPLNEVSGEPLPDFARGIATPRELPPSPGVDEVRVLIPVFPGTNSEDDLSEAFRAAGAQPEFHLIRNLTPALLAQDTETFLQKLEHVQVLAFAGGASLGDEPDGPATFIASFLRLPRVAEAITTFTSRQGLVLGLGNGFQALVKSGFLPYGDPSQVTGDSPTFTLNRQQRHVSRIAKTRVVTVNSPWLAGFEPDQVHYVPVSHQYGRLVLTAEEARSLFAANQVAFQYVDTTDTPTMDAPANPNGSAYAIEGLLSPDGRILGMMSHPERFRPGLMVNIPGISEQSIFRNAVDYLRG